jgi:hypothetical protein
MRRLHAALLITFVAVAALQVVLLGSWGEPTLQYDEVGYELASEAWAAGAQNRFRSPPRAELGRILLHNPGYPATGGLVRWITGSFAGPLRILQALAGLLTGLVMFHALRRRVPETWALVGAAAVWLHPSALFFRLTMWPTALATGGVAVVLLAVLRLADDPDDPSRQWAVGLTFAPLPFFAAPALALVPALLVWPGPRRSWRIAAPFLALWIPWAATVSLTLQSFAPMDVSAPCNLALGNHPLIAEGRGSLWGDAAGRAAFEEERGVACPPGDALTRIRCEARWCSEVARESVGAAPVAAMVRALRRLAETWRADTFVARHFERIGRPAPRGLGAVLTVSHGALLALALLGLLSRDGRAAWVGIGLWCLPILVSVGFTRAREPLLPVLVFAAAVGLVQLRSVRRGRGPGATGR